MAEIPEWGLREDGSLGNTMVPKLEVAQEHLARLASERYDKILELERDKVELAGKIATLESKLREKKHTIALLQETQANHDWWVKRGGELQAELAALRGENEQLVKEFMEIIQSLLCDKPLPDNTWPHLAVCSGDRHAKPGTKGKCCCCKPIWRKELLEAEAELNDMRKPVTVAELKRIGCQGLLAVSAVNAVNALIASRTQSSAPKIGQ